jgi:tRNA(Ile)-lysidine synthase
MALLHLMQPLQLAKGFTLVAVYVNHGLRPAETGKEEERVRSACDNLGVVFETVSVDVAAHAASAKKSLEHAARDLRYAALRNTKENHGATLIAVAHTADDQAEGVLLRLLRGSGLKGLSGMTERSADIIRPLLSVEKETLLSYLHEKNISYCLDSSNTDMRFLRNRIRHKLIPFLEEEFDKGICNALRKTADSLTDDEVFLDDLAERSLQDVILKDKEEDMSVSLALDRHALAGLPASLQRRIIEKILWKTGCNAKYDYIIKIVHAVRSGTPGTELHLHRGLRVGIHRDRLEFVYPEGKIPWRGKLFN